MRRILSLSIRQQIIILIVVMTIVPLGIILYSAAKQRTQDIRDATLIVERFADRISDEENMLLSGTEQLLSTLSHLPAVRKRDVSSVNSLLADLIRINPQYANLLLMDEQGQLWASAVPAKRAISYADRRYFKNALASGRFSSGEFSISRTINKPVMNFGYPIKDSSGKITDVAVVAFTSDRYAQLFKTNLLPARTSLLLTDHKGTILFNLTAPETVGTQDRADLFKRMSEGGGKGTFEAVSNIGIRRYFAFQHLHISGEERPYMYVRAGIQVEQVLHKTFQRLALNLGIMLSMLLLMLGFAFYISKKGIIERIIALRDATQKVSQGDFDVRVANYVSGGELGDLATAFDNMTLALAKNSEDRALHVKALSQYGDIVNNMQVGLYVYHLENPADDRSLRLVAANPRAASLLNVAERDILGRTIDDIFPNLRQEGIPEKFATVVRTGQPVEVDEFYYSDQSVKEATFAFKVFPLPDNRVGVLFEDISLRKNAEAALLSMNSELEQRISLRTAELNELNKELQAFNYSISHDMKAPLIRIKGYADILLDTCAAKLSAEELQYISRLKSASKRLDEHIDALAKLYQISRGDFYREPVDLSALALTIMNGLQDLDPDRKLTFDVAGGLVVNADKVLMKEFLDNLISNAWKYTAKKDDAKIVVGVTKQDGRDIYFVRDNGVGFNIEQVDNIFTPFLRLHKEDTGLGIGLASAQRIIRHHGGRIWAESKEGEGAGFYFTLQ